MEQKISDMRNTERQREDSSPREGELYYGQEGVGIPSREEEGTATAWDGDRDQRESGEKEEICMEKKGEKVWDLYTRCWCNVVLLSELVVVELEPRS